MKRLDEVLARAAKKRAGGVFNPCMDDLVHDRAWEDSRAHFTTALAARGRHVLALGPDRGKTVAALTVIAERYEADAGFTAIFALPTNDLVAQKMEELREIHRESGGQRPLWKHMAKVTVRDTENCAEFEHFTEFKRVDDEGGKAFCGSCELRGDCLYRGFLEQVQREQRARILFTTHSTLLALLTEWDDEHLHEAFKGGVDLLVIDESPFDTLCEAVEVTAEQIETLASHLGHYGDQLRRAIARLNEGEERVVTDLAGWLPLDFDDARFQASPIDDAMALGQHSTQAIEFLSEYPDGRAVALLKDAAERRYDGVVYASGRLLFPVVHPLELDRVRTAILLDATATEAGGKALFGEAKVYRDFWTEIPDTTEIRHIMGWDAAKSRFRDEFDDDDEDECIDDAWVDDHVDVVEGSRPQQPVPDWAASIEVDAVDTELVRRAKAHHLRLFHLLSEMPRKSLLVTFKALNPNADDHPDYSLAREIIAQASPRVDVIHYNGTEARGSNRFREHGQVLMLSWHVPQHAHLMRAWMLRRVAEHSGAVIDHQTLMAVAQHQLIDAPKLQALYRIAPTRGGKIVYWATALSPTLSPVQSVPVDQIDAAAFARWGLAPKNTGSGFLPALTRQALWSAEAVWIMNRGFGGLFNHLPGIGESSQEYSTPPESLQCLASDYKKKASSAFDHHFQHNYRRLAIAGELELAELRTSLGRRYAASLNAITTEGVLAAIDTLGLQWSWVEVHGQRILLDERVEELEAAIMGLDDPSALSHEEIYESLAQMLGSYRTAQRRVSEVCGDLAGLRERWRRLQEARLNALRDYDDSISGS